MPRNRKNWQLKKKPTPEQKAFTNNNIVTILLRFLGVYYGLGVKALLKLRQINSIFNRAFLVNMPNHILHNWKVLPDYHYFPINHSRGFGNYRYLDNHSYGNYYREGWRHRTRYIITSKVMRPLIVESKMNPWLKTYIYGTMPNANSISEYDLVSTRPFPECVQEMECLIGSERDRVYCNWIKIISFLSFLWGFPYDKYSPKKMSTWENWKKKFLPYLRDTTLINQSKDSNVEQNNKFIIFYFPRDVNLSICKDRGYYHKTNVSSRNMLELRINNHKMDLRFRRNSMVLQSKPTTN